MNDTLLKRAALADGLISLLVAALLVADAALLAGPFGLSQTFIATAGWVIVPFALAWLYVASTGSRPLARFGVIGNLVWSAASIAAIPILSPTFLGAAFIAAQAVTVLALAYYQNKGLQRTQVGA